MSRILLVANPKSGVKSNKNILDLTISEFEKKSIEYTSLEELLTIRKDLSKDDINLIADLLRKMLNYNWKDRITAEKCLQHPWLK